MLQFNLQVNNAGVGGLMVEGDVVIVKDLIEGDFVTISAENGVRYIVQF